MENRCRIVVAILFSALAVSSCTSQHPRSVRMPAVAGQFYPADSTALVHALAALFEGVKEPATFDSLAALIAPHAGYIFSGGVAASAYVRLDPAKNYDNIFILGPAHTVAFDGAALYLEGDYKTPLGIVEVNTELERALIGTSKIFKDRSDAHVREHSIEVQLPFLQYRMTHPFRIVPIVIGGDDPETPKKVAEALRPYFTRRNLFVISTDFSHYPAYDDAVRADRESAEAVCANSFDRLLETLRSLESRGIRNLATAMCGSSCALTLAALTEHQPGISYEAVLYKNSGDAGVGGRDRVVGYNAIVVAAREVSAGRSGLLTDGEKAQLLAIARRTVGEYLASGTIAPPAGELPAVFQTKSGAFVTLRKNGVLRGCIGRFDASEPLYRIIQEMAVAAATQDPRFAAVTADELPDLAFEISVLTPLKKINSIDEFIPGRHGITVRKGNRSGTFLPQVADETGWTREEMLGHCAQDKAGLGWNGWKGADLYIYEAIVFGEHEGINRK